MLLYYLNEGKFGLFYEQMVFIFNMKPWPERLDMPNIKFKEMLTFILSKI